MSDGYSGPISDTDLKMARSRVAAPLPRPEDYTPEGLRLAFLTYQADALGLIARLDGVEAENEFLVNENELVVASRNRLANEAAIACAEQAKLGDLRDAVCEAMPELRLRLDSWAQEIVDAYLAYEAAGASRG